MGKGRLTARENGKGKAERQIQCGNCWDAAFQGNTCASVKRQTNVSSLPLQAKLLGVNITVKPRSYGRDNKQTLIVSDFCTALQCCCLLRWKRPLSGDRTQGAGCVCKCDCVGMY